MSYEVIDNIKSAESDIPYGVSLNFKTVNTYDYNYLNDQQAKDNLINILLTQRGERVENIEFGSDLLKMLFQPITDELKADINETIINSTSTWAPYININEIDIRTAEDDLLLNETIEISISFSAEPFLRNTDLELLILANQDGSLETR
jgi:phage baseplate assembly protein W